MQANWNDVIHGFQSPHYPLLDANPRAPLDGAAVPLVMSLSYYSCWGHYSCTGAELPAAAQAEMITIVHLQGKSTLGS